MTDDKRSKNEFMKEKSRFLRGTIAEGLTHVETGAISEDDFQLLKFHGSYMQDDRDVRGERAKKKLEKAYMFMIRLRIPGGFVKPAQWRQLDDIAMTYANHSLRITTRATFQFHGVIKSNLKRTMQAINAACFDTIAACGDVNRGVMSVANPYLSKAHQRSLRAGAANQRSHAAEDRRLSRDLAGRRAGRRQGGSADGRERADLRRRIICRANSRSSSPCRPTTTSTSSRMTCGFIAIVENGKLVGWNVTVGGGMGMTHGEADTFPRTADVLGFCPPEQVIEVAEKILTVQRDWGNRSNRASARASSTRSKIAGSTISAPRSKSASVIR